MSEQDIVERLCGECRKPIEMMQPYYVRNDPWGKVAPPTYFHSACGDPLGLKAKDAEITTLRELNARLVKHDGSAQAVCDGYALEHQQFSDEIDRLRTGAASLTEQLHTAMSDGSTLRSRLAKAEARVGDLEAGPCPYCKAKNLRDKNGWHCLEVIQGHVAHEVFCRDLLRFANQDIFTQAAATLGPLAAVAQSVATPRPAHSPAGASADEEAAMSAIVARIAKWAHENPGAVAGDAEGERLLTLVRQLRAVLVDHHIVAAINDAERAALTAALGN